MLHQLADSWWAPSCSLRVLGPNQLWRCGAEQGIYRACCVQLCRCAVSAATRAAPCTPRLIETLRVAEGMQRALYLSQRQADVLLRLLRRECCRIGRPACFVSLAGLLACSARCLAGWAMTLRLRGRLRAVSLWM